MSDVKPLKYGFNLKKHFEWYQLFLQEKIKRGYYSVTIREISKNPKKTEEFEITNKYMEMMETTILRAPEYWLWTHNRWKHKRS